MKKTVILLLGLLCVAPVFAQTAAAANKTSLDRALEQAVLKQLKKNSALAPRLNEVDKLLNTVAKRLSKELGKPVTATQVVELAYRNRMATFKEDAAHEYKWRTEVPGAMKVAVGSTEKEFAAHYKHTIDYAFNYVFGPKYTNTLFDYGNGPTGYDKTQYAREPDVEVFGTDSELEICNLFNNLEWVAKTTDDGFRTYWAWLLEK